MKRHKQNPDMYPRNYTSASVKRTRVTSQEENEIRAHYAAFKSNITQTARAFKRSTTTVNKIVSKQRSPV